MVKHAKHNMRGDETPTFYEDLIESCQPRLKSFVFSLLGSAEDTNDVLQETNRVLWRKKDQYEEGTNFEAWASKIAFFQVMAHRKRISRDRLVFGADLLHTMADELAEDAPFAAESEHLEPCVNQLADRQRKAVELFYFEGQNSEQVANHLGIKANAVSQLLFRARENIAKCIKKRTRKLSS